MVRAGGLFRMGGCGQRRWDTIIWFNVGVGGWDGGGLARTGPSTLTCLRMWRMMVRARRSIQTWIRMWAVVARACGPSLILFLIRSILVRASGATLTCCKMWG